MASITEPNTRQTRYGHADGSWTSEVVLKNIPGALPQVDVESMPDNSIVTGIITAAGEAVYINIPDGCASVGLQITGTWVGTISFESSLDDTNWVAIGALNGTGTVISTTSNGIFILPGAGYYRLRVRATAWTSGTAYINFNASIGASDSWHVDGKGAAGVPAGGVLTVQGQTGAYPNFVSESWRVSQLSDVTANDSDKSFTVPANTEYQILGIYVELTTTATAGNRELNVQVQTGAGVVTERLGRASVLQTASLTRYYLFGPGVADMLAFRGSPTADLLTTPIPVTSLLLAAQVLRVWDKNAIDPAADDMNVYVQIASRQPAPRHRACPPLWKAHANGHCNRRALAGGLGVVV
jgi:hypothetical protein